MRNKYILALMLLCLSNNAFADFSLVGTHPYAVINTVGADGGYCEGRNIRQLQVHDGLIYSGYGNGGCNSGPIELCALNPVDNTFICEFQQNTEAVRRFSVLDGDLYSISIDPSGTVWGDAYAAKVDGAWYARSVASLDLSDSNPYRVVIHAQDMGKLGQDLYFAGDYWNGPTGNEGAPWTGWRQYAALWKSSDNGNSWTNVLSFPQYGGNTYVEGIEPSTFCFAATLNNKLYVQAATFGCGRRDESVLHTSRVWDGNSWSIGPSFFPTSSSTQKVRNFKDQLVMIHGSKLYSFNGNTTTLRNDEYIRDYAIDGEKLYILTSFGEVCETTTLESFRCFDDVPSSITAFSIAALDEQVYVGTTDSRIFKAPIPPEPEFEFIKYKNYLIPIKSN